jgi:hypothetical protein
LLAQRARNEEARRAFVDEFPVLAAAEVASLAATPVDREIVVRMLEEDRLLVVPIDEGRYPAFQFDGRGRPKPVVVDALAALRRAGLRGWQLPLFFGAAWSSLDDRRAVDVLDTDPAGVLRVAQAIDAIPW